MDNSGRPVQLGSDLQRGDMRRYAAILVLREIASCMPTFFFQNVSWRKVCIGVNVIASGTCFRLCSIIDNDTGRGCSESDTLDIVFCVLN